jgi:predicted esterase
MKNILILSILFALVILGFRKNEVPTDNGMEDKLIQGLDEWLAIPVEKRKPLENLNFSKESLTKTEAENAAKRLFQDKQDLMKVDYEKQWDSRKITFDGKNMPFYYQKFGVEPSDGRSLFISLHGGGQTRSVVNDQQYENQKHLYDQTMSTLEGVYLAARAPTNSWNLWHEEHIDDFLNIIIQMAVALENVNPNKVYLLGYSAGGDGVYQLAPRMADRLAAASMMAGHPNESSPLGLKNIPFAIHVGALDDAYDRNIKAQEWKIMLEDLENNAPGTYIHDVQVHDGLGHWMNHEDAVALTWMKKYQRNPIPEKIVWKQDNRHHTSFYWIGVPEASAETSGEIIVEYNTQQNEVNIISNYSNILHIYINDKMLDLDEPITIKYQGKIISQKTFDRSIANIQKTLSIKGDSELSFPSVISVIKNETVQE